MKFSVSKILACCIAMTCANAAPPRAEFGARFAAAEKAKASVVAGADGWLFLASELRMLSFDRFWSDAAANASRAPKAEWADPVPAIVDFQTQLKARGIDLLLVPVPPKAAIYPEKLVAGAAPQDALAPLTEFYAALKSAGVEVLDLGPLMLAAKNGEHGPVFCATDTHWSGSGCVLAAQAIAKAIGDKIQVKRTGTFSAEWKTVAIHGDLAELPGAAGAGSAEEKISVRTVNAAGGAAVEPDPGSSVLLIGDSHTLVFHDFLAQHAGLLDQLAAELGIVPDLIGTRGSGATPVRVSLFRKSIKEPAYLAKKKVVVWCFTAREFTEAESGWQKVPVAR
jgi:alginate O-acetyltransferase complex protein AlgJ